MKGVLFWGIVISCVLCAVSDHQVDVARERFLNDTQRFLDGAAWMRARKMRQVQDVFTPPDGYQIEIHLVKVSKGLVL